METVEKRVTVEMKITDLLRGQSDALGAKDLAKKLDVPLNSIKYSLSNLKRKGSILHTGQMPWHYTINDQEPNPEKGLKLVSEGSTNITDNISGTNNKKVVILITENKDAPPLDARDIAEKLGKTLNTVRTTLSTLKKIGIIKIVGNKPWHYIINDEPVSKKEPLKKTVKKEVVQPEEQPVKPGVRKPGYIQRADSPTMDDFEEYLMVYTTQESKIPLLKSFKSSKKFSEEFETQQQRPNLTKIAGYRKLACRKRVIFTPEIK